LEIKKFYIFPKPFWNSLIEVNISNLQKECYEIRKNIPSKNKSNLGQNSYHSPNLCNFKNPPEILKLMKQITKRIQAIHQESRRENVRLVDFWININGKGGSNVPHTHPGAKYSGVFYIKVPQEMKGGNLLFLKDYNERFLQSEENMGFFKQGYKFLPNDLPKIPVKPEEKLLIVFPSWLPHSVEPNDIDEERISLSFNYILFR
jgi:uncharacterized protein (TIGR02466 family)|tara:strand:- start:170 stop:781 length:612 start_codon:yes stop_codon:yes gene_type:complete